MRVRGGGRFLLLGSLICAGVVAVACSGDETKKGAIMLAVTTNMQAPKDVDSVGLRITSNGVPIFDDTRQVAPNGEVRFPATLAILASQDPRAVVKIRLVAFRSSQARILRDAITTVPVDRVALLRLPIHWLSDGSGIGDTTVPLTELRSICTEPDTTSIDGRCGSAIVDSSSLPNYDEAEVFGGGSSARGDGACFDTRACFEKSGTLPVDTASCTVVRPPGISHELYNVGIVLPPGSDGECLGGACFIPLDAGSASGWTESPAPNADGSMTLHLPDTVCRQIAAGKALGVAASYGCSAKVESTPLCGIASAVTGAPIAPVADAGASIDTTLELPDTSARSDSASRDAGPVGPEDVFTSLPGVTGLSHAGDLLFVGSSTDVWVFKKSTRALQSHVSLTDSGGGGSGVVMAGGGVQPSDWSIGNAVPASVLNSRSGSLLQCNLVAGTGPILGLGLDDAGYAYIHRDTQLQQCITADGGTSLVDAGGGGPINFFVAGAETSTNHYVGLISTQTSVMKCWPPESSTCTVLANNVPAPGPLAMNGAMAFFLSPGGKVHSTPLTPATTDATELVAGENLSPANDAGTITYLPQPIAANSTHVFWLDRSGQVRRVAGGGGSVATVASGQPADVRSIVADDTYAYWLVPSQNLVRRAPVQP